MELIQLIRIFSDKWSFIYLFALLALILLIIRILVSAILKKSFKTKSFLEIILKTLIIAFGLLVILAYSGLPTISAAIGVGIATLAIVLALHESIANYIAGIHIMLEKLFDIGDYIRLDSKLSGYVTDIGWRTTRLRKIENNVILIPNKQLTEGTVVNYSLPQKQFAISIPISIANKLEPQRIEHILMDESTLAAKYIPGLLKEPAPSIRFQPNFEDSALHLILIVYINEINDKLFVRHELTKRIVLRFKKERIEFPTPKLVVEINNTI